MALSEIKACFFSRFPNGASCHVETSKSVIMAPFQNILQSKISLADEDMGRSNIYLSNLLYQSLSYIRQLCVCSVHSLFFFQFRQSVMCNVIDSMSIPSSAHHSRSLNTELKIRSNEFFGRRNTFCSKNKSIYYGS